MKEKPLSVRLREGRRFMGNLNQAKFAQKLGLQARQYANYELGKYDDTPATLQRDRLEQKLGELIRLREKELKALDEAPFTQQGDVGQRIAMLEKQVADIIGQVSDLNRAVVKIQTKLD